MKNIALAWCGTGTEEAQKCQTMFPHEAAHYLEQADRICNRTFLFEGHWEMEKTNKPVIFQEQIDWYFKPEGDPEWTYAFNRLSFLPVLAKAYAVSKNEKYGLHYCQLLEDWIDRVPLNDSTRQTAWRSIEAGLRCENWLKSLPLIKDCQAFTGDFFQKVNTSLALHADELLAAHHDFHRLSNWGVLQDHGLFLLGIYFQQPDWLETSLKRLAENLHLQILPDGVHWEQSPQYHAEVLHCLLDVIQVAGRLAVSLPEGFSETVHKMSVALAHWCKPDGHLLCQSDSDDVDARDLLVQAACLFQDPFLKACAGSQYFDENLWDLGAAAITQYEQLPAAKAPTHSLALSHSGNYILRSPSGDDAAVNYLHMHCGCLGSGHGHADLLHIDLYGYGEDILIDSGRYNYQDIPIRRHLKSPAAHNTFTIDGKDFTRCQNAWDYSPIAMPVKSEYLFTPTADYISGGHLGYIQEGLYVSRKIVHIKPDIYLLFDQVYGQGQHDYTQYFHFNNQGTVSQNGRLISYAGTHGQAVLMTLTANGTLNLTTASLSRTYNTLEEGKCLLAEHHANGCTCMITAISVAAAGALHDVNAELLPVSLTRTGEILSEQQAQAVRVIRNKEEFTVICLHQEVIAEVGLLAAGPYCGYGKVLLFSPENPGGVCLSY